MMTLSEITPQVLVNILFGIVLLLMGRQLFWVFVAIIGFVYGFEISMLFFPELTGPSAWMIALGGGAAGALAALFLQPLAAGVAGFLSGGYILPHLIYGPQWVHAEYSWLLVILGGVAGFVLVVILLDWALIILSALIGAVLILQSINLDPQLHALATVFVCVIGVIVQYQSLTRVWETERGT